MDENAVTIVVVPRERFSQTERSLECLYKNTPLPFDLVYVDAGSPPPIQRYLQTASKRHNFRLVRTEHFLTPNQARNLVLPQVKSKYVVFFDNDALVQPGWLDKLIACAEETGAWIVGPLYQLGEFAQQTIHVAGVVGHFKEENGQRIFEFEHLHADSPMSDIRTPLTRRAVDFVEFHCMLIRGDALQRVLPFDDQLFGLYEEMDLCMRVARAGGTVFMEPDAVTTHIPPPPGHWRDLPFFLLRWSEAWMQATARHFNQKWGFSLVRSYDDPTDLGTEETILRWARGHRRLLADLHIPPNGDDRPETSLEEAQCMLALFQTVDRAVFDLLLTAEDDLICEEWTSLDPEAVMRQLPNVLAQAAERNLTALVRPLPEETPQPVALLRFDDVDPDRLARLRSHAFLVLETAPATYQCWMAIAKGDPRSTTLWRRQGFSALVADPEPVPLPGYRNLSGGARHRVRLVEGRSGLLSPLWQLEEQGLVPLLREGRVV